MKTRVQKWGNSLALRIPKSLADDVGLHRETPVTFSLVDGKLVITPEKRPVPTLRQLLAKVTEENLHHEVDTGAATGNEACKSPGLAHSQSGADMRPSSRHYVRRA